MNQDKKNTSVLLIDDNEIDNYINEKIIRSMECASNINVFKSGQSALEFFLNIDRNYDSMNVLLPEVVFIDLNMPLMNGFQFMAEFEKFDEKVKKGIQFVILTSSLDPKDHQNSNSNPRVTRFLNKPLSEEELEDILC